MNFAISRESHFTETSNVNRPKSISVIGQLIPHKKTQNSGLRIYTSMERHTYQQRFTNMKTNINTILNKTIYLAKEITWNKESDNISSNNLSEDKTYVLQTDQPCLVESPPSPEITTVDPDMIQIYCPPDTTASFDGSITDVVSGIGTYGGPLYKPKNQTNGRQATPSETNYSISKESDSIEPQSGIIVDIVIPDDPTGKYILPDCRLPYSQFVAIVNVSPLIIDYVKIFINSEEFDRYENRQEKPVDSLDGYQSGEIGQGQAFIYCGYVHGIHIEARADDQEWVCITPEATYNRKICPKDLTETSSESSDPKSLIEFLW